MLLKLVRDDADIEVCMRGGFIVVVVVVVVVKVGHNSPKLLWPDVCCISDVVASCIFTATILFLSKLPPVVFKLVVTLLETKSESFVKLLLKSATFFYIIKIRKKKKQDNKHTLILVWKFLLALLFFFKF